MLAFASILKHQFIILSIQFIVDILNNDHVFVRAPSISFELENVDLHFLNGCWRVRIWVFLCGLAMPVFYSMSGLDRVAWVKFLHQPSTRGRILDGFEGSMVPKWGFPGKCLLFIWITFAILNIVLAGRALNLFGSLILGQSRRSNPLRSPHFTIWINCLNYY